ncbi:hypothetical protein YDYSY3_36630 [Paenibacillus chitinolyticus]|uniref:GNAT family N-acetyltransferase n=1 Tax=Paenibacillus chitinolyticus TaxID=79263 RepID=UPI0026E498B3|nr:GNAT family N-acetyltransferase [Paenibacillus chitinolyticus]GKS12663.1 hypothetical protein YDYSY3_36630 [Paenibacillus chitinolyticus]
MNEPGIVTLNTENIGGEHICCAISDKKCANGVQLKKAWLQQRFQEGLRFKKLDVRQKVFIEYIPAEYAWCPVEAPGYIFINCFWVAGSYKGKGYGKKLLGECLEESGATNGAIAVTSRTKRPYLSDKSFFTYNGFEVCDQAPPYFELVVLKFKEDAPTPYTSYSLFYNGHFITHEILTRSKFEKNIDGWIEKYGLPGAE